MKAKRVSILVSEETHQWIVAEVRRLEVEAQRSGGYQCPAYKGEVHGNSNHISIEAMLLIMLDARQRHRERRRKARLARRPRPAKLPSAAAMARIGERRE